jgi:hypothetical protein
MTTNQTLKAQPKPTLNTMTIDSIQGVRGTGRIKTAGLRFQWRKKGSIKANARYG